MNIFLMVHEYKQGYTCYAFSSFEKRNQAEKILRKQHKEDFEHDRDFILLDIVELDEMPTEGE